MVVGIGIDAIREQVAVAVPGVSDPVDALQALGVVSDETSTEVPIKVCDYKLFIVG